MADRIYRAADGRWICLVGDQKTYYATQALAQAALNLEIRGDTIMAKKSAFITAYRQKVTDWLRSLDEDLVGLEAEYAALSYSTVLADGDFADGNSDLTAQEFKDAVASIKTIRTAFHNGTHDTRLYKIKS